MGFRLDVILFSTFICILTAASLAITVYSVVDVYTEMQYVWAYPLLVFGWIFAFAFAFDMLGSEKLSRKKLLFLTLGLVLLSSGVTHVVWVVATPRWSFSVSTDKSTYELGEPVQITATLENHGYIPQTFTSAVDDAITVNVEWGPFLPIPVWNAPYKENQTAFTISPRQRLVRTFVWNQTNTVNPWFWNTTYMPGTYLINAFVPKRGGATIFEDYYDDMPFWATTYINVTATR
jgi:hypothetical protein